jgi:hypothetical protein
MGNLRSQLSRRQSERSVDDDDLLDGCLASALIEPAWVRTGSAVIQLVVTPRRLGLTGIAAATSLALGMRSLSASLGRAFVGRWQALGCGLWSGRASRVNQFAGSRSRSFRPTQ